MTVAFPVRPNRVGSLSNQSNAEKRGPDGFPLFESATAIDVGIAGLQTLEVAHIRPDNAIGDSMLCRLLAPSFLDLLDSSKKPIDGALVETTPAARNE